MKRYYVVINIEGKIEGFVTKPMKFFRPFLILKNIERAYPKKGAQMNIIYHYELSPIDELDFDDFMSVKYGSEKL